MNAGKNLYLETNKMISTTLILIGAFVAITGISMLIMETFYKSVWWGLGCLVFAPVALVFIVMYWQESKRAVLMQVCGFVALVCGVALG